MPDDQMVENQLRKLRRRLEDYLRQKATLAELINLADSYNINVPKNLRKLIE